MRWYSIFFAIALLVLPRAALAAGEDCGGIAGLTCRGNEFCNYSLDAQCGAGDQTGICTVKPEICTRIFAPVCGCDGKSYPNACTAAAAGVSVAAQGECGSDFSAASMSEGFCIQVVVCGFKDGEWKEYGNPCDAREDGAQKITPKVGDSCPAVQ